MSQDATFSRESGMVLNSPYFTSPPEGDSVHWWNERTKERQQLQDAITTANTYDDLPEDAKKIYDLAYKSVEDAMDAADAADRFTQPIAVIPVDEGE